MKWLSLFIVYMMAAMPLLSYNEPTYKVIVKHGDIELREYPPLLVAEVQASGTRKEAIKSGFRILANYIFGNNSLKTKIAMTAPIMEQSSTQNISLASPIEDHLKGTKWLIKFILPQNYTLETAPKPDSSQISIKKSAGRKIRCYSLHRSFKR